MVLGVAEYLEVLLPYCIKYKPKFLGIQKTKYDRYTN